ncbi:hypothetical protein ASJ33_07855 [Dehalococcoides mccartyi]|nr:hypothetical protein ASJ33_07855 [Dehalococcoides mccartyi]
MNLNPYVICIPEGKNAQHYSDNYQNKPYYNSHMPMIKGKYEYNIKPKSLFTLTAERGQI